MKLTGGCICSAVRYELNEPPLFVHACHCTDCQRFSGSAFVVLMGVEKAVFDLKGTTEKVTNATPSGSGYDAHYCPTCSTVIWSKYHFVEAPLIAVRAGTLDEPQLAPPNYHIFTQSQQPWLLLPDDALTFEGWLDPEQAWSPETLQRFAEISKKRERRD